jgi:hypothetical protein
VSVLDDLPLLTDDELDLCTPEELDIIEAMYDAAFAQAARDDEDDWAHWLPGLLPNFFTADFGPHHGEMWAWIWSIDLGTKPADAFVGIFPRGGAKSTSAEGGVVSLAARSRRKYGLYICDTQAQADDHVGNIASMLESSRIGQAYPELGERLVGKFGSSKGWRRNRLRTASGFTIDALGLDSAARGLKLDEDRPDLMVFDDLDNEDDGPGQVQSKVDKITKKLLPAGSDDLAILMIQNLVHPQGVFARLAGLAEIPADFLQNRIVCGPIPALEDATFEAQPDGSWLIIEGTPTWAGQDREKCQSQVDDWGITAFRTEAQHDTDAKGGGMFDHIVFQHCRRDEMPALVRVEVWVDPAVTATDNSDSMAIQVDGMGVDRTIYRMRSWEHRASPVDALGLAIAWGLLEGASRIGVETDQGGDTWQSVYREAFTQVMADIALIEAGDPIDAARRPEYLEAIVELAGRDDDLPDLSRPHFAEEKAGSTQMPKAHRVQQMVPDYEKARRIVHVLGTHRTLERSLFRFPRTKPFDLADAAYWGWNALRLFGQPVRTNKQAMRRKMPSQPFGPSQRQRAVIR